MSRSTPSFQPSCPSGGDWYACGNGAKFVGCCTSDPCNDNGCFQGNLRPASFLASAYGTFPDQQCTDGQWYTCSGTNPTFMGCCSVNPCNNNGCPDQYLEAAYLSNNPTQANAFDPQPPLSGSTTSVSSSVVPSATSTSLPNTDSAPVDNTSTPKTVSTGAIAGAVVGGVLVLLLILAAVILMLRRRRRRQLTEHYHQTPSGADTTWSGSPYTRSSRLFDKKAPPTYSMHPTSQHRGSGVTSPMMEVFEADSREVSDYGSPRSPGFRSEQTASIRPVSGLAVRSVYNDGSDQILELDASERERLHGGP